MFTKMMKWLSIVALLVLLVVLRRSSGDYRTFLIAFLVWAGATVVLVQAARNGKYFWMAAFLTIAVFFNPIVPISLSRNLFLTFDVISPVLFILALVALKTSPTLSIASITDRTPGSESL